MDAMAQVGGTRPHINARPSEIVLFGRKQLDFSWNLTSCEVYAHSAETLLRCFKHHDACIDTTGLIVQNSQSSQLRPYIKLKIAIATLQEEVPQ